MLHPQARALLDLMIERQVPPTHTLPVADARQLYRDRRFYTQPAPPELAEVRDLDAAGTRCRLYRPDGVASSNVPALVYFHGGGWVIGDLLAREIPAPVLSVAYRLAPEHRFPAAADDCIAATRWVAGQAGVLGIDSTRLAVGGDSAGGNLAAVVALAAREAGDLPLAYQLLIYPATDQRRGAPSHTTNADGYLLTRDSIRWYHDHYLEGDAHDEDWRASPLLHQDLTGLPPALVLTAGFDPLRDEGAQYAQALGDAGNRVAYVCFERQIHGFVTMGKVLDEANTAVGLCAAELRRALRA
jgi:acetyl esterase